MRPGTWGCNTIIGRNCPTAHPQRSNLPVPDSRAGPGHPRGHPLP